jgi:uncharacterized protein
MEEAKSDQAAVLDFMASPDAYRSVHGKVERIETHASVVFLAGPRAYKIKRAVKYPSRLLDPGAKAARSLERASPQSPHSASYLS